MSTNKDIYEHLAKVYFERSRKKKKKSFLDKINNKSLLKFGSIIAGCLIIVLMTALFTQRPEPKSQVALVLENNITKINYHFNQAKKETATFDLRDIDISRYSFLNFRVRKTNYRDQLHMCVEFTSAYGEKSRVYLKQVSRQWQDFKINLTDFKNISDWSNMRELLFIVEQWNVQSKNGIVYIDNICFLK